MIAKSLKLRHYRNYETLELALSPGVNVFSGENAQGKTNLLEAIYLCSCARSHRTAKDIELIQKGHDAYEVELDYLSKRLGFDEQLDSFSWDDPCWEENKIKLCYEAAKGNKAAQRRFFYNHVQQDKISNLYSLFNAVIFAPEDLLMVKEGPQTRRRFLDLLLSQIKNRYFVSLQRFNHLLLQRNKLLKQMRERQKERLDMALEHAQLDIWDTQYAEEMAQIIGERFCYVADIQEEARQFQQRISREKEDLQMSYRSLPGLKAEDSAKERLEKIKIRLKQQREDDILRGSSGIGPHRDDLELRLNGQLLKTYGSQGQQRTAVLAMKMAELAILRKQTGQTPVLLLDDVMSELDEQRRRCLVAAMEHCQVFLSCTDTKQVKKELETLGQNQSIAFFHVDDGKIMRLQEK